MKGKLSKSLRRVWVLIALLSVLQPSGAVNKPSTQELHALTDFADANAMKSMGNGGKLSSWRFDWDAQGNWIGGNPCRGYKGLRCWSTGAVRVLSVPSLTLQGPISPALGNLTSLTQLVLLNNQLTGEVGPILKNMPLMKTLRLQGNRFSGSLIDWVQNMHSLVELRLGGNSFVGDLSTGVFANLPYLTIVDVSNNSLSGPIPDYLFRVSSLQQLSLGGNNFTGSVPPSISNSSLTTLDLSRNSMSGELPTVWNMPNLTRLDLSRNNLSGPIPDQLMSLPRIETLNLTQNNFLGNVSSVHTSKFGCSAFDGNPGLVLEDSHCKVRAPRGSSAPTPPSMGDRHFQKDKSLSPLTIVALAIGNIALILMSVVVVVVFYIWWKKKDIREVDYLKQWNAIASKGDHHSSKDIKTESSSFGSIATGTDLTPSGPIQSSARSSFAAKPDVKPALKSVVGTILDPAKDSYSSRDAASADESFSVSDFRASVVILDTTLMLKLEDLLAANALVLGAGSFGLVYMACLEDGEMLAIKTIEELVLREKCAFAKQCARLADVLHPNLLQLRAYCWSPQEKLLVFDYMQNGSVHSLLHGGKSSAEDGERIDWPTRLKIAVGTARALAHLHDIDMVHGNIKAKNVLLDEEYEPRVSDFGIEKLLISSLPKDIGANEGYLAPELSNSATRRRTEDGDVYSLGVFLLELLTGKLPVDNEGVDLPTWVQEMTAESRKVQLFDPVLTSMHILPAQDILEFLELAQACVSVDAAARPSITIVLRCLESIVPGSTAPRSYLKDDNIDSDASFRQTPENRRYASEFVNPVEDSGELSSYTSDNPKYAQAFVNPVEDSGELSSYTSENPKYAPDSGELSSDRDKFTVDPFSPGFIRPVRVKMSPEQILREESRMVCSPVSSAGTFYSNVSTPTESASGDRKRFRLIRPQ